MVFIPRPKNMFEVGNWNQEVPIMNTCNQIMLKLRLVLKKLSNQNELYLEYESIKVLGSPFRIPNMIPIQIYWCCFLPLPSRKEV
jgi:hypothetical protein